MSPEVRIMIRPHQGAQSNPSAVESALEVSDFATKMPRRVAEDQSESTRPLQVQSQKKAVLRSSSRIAAYDDEDSESCEPPVVAEDNSGYDLQDGQPGSESRMQSRRVSSKQHTERVRCANPPCATQDATRYEVWRGTLHLCRTCFAYQKIHSGKMRSEQLISKNRQRREAIKTQIRSHKQQVTEASISSRYSLPRSWPPVQVINSQFDAFNISCDRERQDFSKDPNRHLLSKQELDLASTLWESCEQFLEFRGQLGRKWIEHLNEGKDFQYKSYARSDGYDYKKMERIWVAFRNAGLFKIEYLEMVAENGRQSDISSASSGRRAYTTDADNVLVRSIREGSREGEQPQIRSRARGKVAQSGLSNNESRWKGHRRTPLPPSQSPIGTPSPTEYLAHRSQPANQLVLHESSNFGPLDTPGDRSNRIHTQHGFDNHHPPPPQQQQQQQVQAWGTGASDPTTNQSSGAALTHFRKFDAADYVRQAAEAGNQLEIIRQERDHWRNQATVAWRNLMRDNPPAATLAQKERENNHLNLVIRQMQVLPRNVGSPGRPQGGSSIGGPEPLDRTRIADEMAKLDALNEQVVLGLDVVSNGSDQVVGRLTGGSEPLGLDNPRTQALLERSTGSRPSQFMANARKWVILRAFIAAAVSHWVFETDFPCPKEIDIYREMDLKASYLRYGPQEKTITDIAAHRLFMKTHQFEIMKEKRANELTNDLSTELMSILTWPFNIQDPFGLPGRSKVVQLFRNALDLKARLCLNQCSFVLIFAKRGYDFNPATIDSTNDTAQARPLQYGDQFLQANLWPGMVMIETKVDSNHQGLLEQPVLTKSNIPYRNIAWDNSINETQPILICKAKVAIDMKRRLGSLQAEG